LSAQAAQARPTALPTREAAAPAPPAPQATSWRLYTALALGSLALAALSILYPSTPSYDPWGWLLWGRQILHLDLNTVAGNSFKPLPVLFTAPFALFGRAQPDLWLVVARAGALFSIAMAFKLAARLTIWCGAGPRGSKGLARALAYGPAILAGTVAAVGVLVSAQYVRDAALGYSECLGAGAVLLAIDLHLSDKARAAFAIGLIPALDRPEIWAFWGLYGLYLWRRDPGARKLVVALFALVPCLWFLPELWGSGHLFRGVSRALHPRANSAAFAKCPFCSEMKAAVNLTLTRAKLVAGVVALGCAVAVWRGVRGRAGGLAAAVQAQSRRPAGVMLALAAMAIVWFIEISAMTQYGFSGNGRYLIVGGALIVVLAGVGWGLAAWKLGELLGRWFRAAAGGAARAGATAAAAAALGLVYLFVPSWAAARLNARKLDHALRYQAELRRDLTAIIAKAGGAGRLLACGTLETEAFQKQMVAWYLDVPTVQVAATDARPPKDQPVSRDPNVILQTRDTGTARWRPYVPPNERYTETTLRTFRLYEHCR
jgi:hypothetical protein